MKFDKLKAKMALQLIFCLKTQLILFTFLWSLLDFICNRFATTGKLEEVVLKEANVLLKKLETVVENPVDVAVSIYCSAEQCEHIM